MRQFDLSTFTQVMRLFDQVQDILPLKDKENVGHVLEIISLAKNECKKLPLTSSVDRMFSKLENRLAQHPLMDIRQGMTDIHDEVAAQLSEHVFFYIRPDLRQYYDADKKLFGSEVEDKCPMASGDISAAGRCFALEEWTACVFHLMRVLETGLRELAIAIGIEVKGDQQMHSIISDCRTELDRLMGSQQITKAHRNYFDEALAYLESSKNAWRNYVAHARVTYDEQDARRIMQSVDSFMRYMCSDQR